MIPITLLISKIAPVFVMMALGFGLRRLKALTTEADHSLMRVTVNVFYPALILRFALGNPVLNDTSQLLLAPAVGFSTVAMGFALAWACAPLMRSKHPKTRGTFALTTGIYNYGYIAIPVVLALFGEAAEGTVAMLLVHNVGVEVAFWTVGVALVTAGSGRSLWSRLLNAPLFALIAALLLNATGLEAHLPIVIEDSILWLSHCAIPVGLILAGATLADLLREEDIGSLVRSPKPGLLASLLRLGLLPVLFLLLARFLPLASDDLRRVILVQAAMPAGIFPLVVTRHYGGDTRTAMLVVLGTTLLGLITIPLWIQAGLWWVF